jgi:nicotinamide-nucleotide amidase
VTGATAPQAASDTAAQVLRLLGSRGATVAVAESLTGGLLGAALTSVPGASAAFRGGVVSYATDLKASLLGVDPALLAAEGAVHPDVALQMAAGVRRACGAAYGLSTTGVAGPQPQDGQAVGTVHVAVAGPEGSRVAGAVFPGDRDAVRRAAVEAALALLADVLGESGG